MTASVLAEDREKALASGMDDFLPKPVRAEGLRSLLERWTGAKPSSLPPSDGQNRRGQEVADAAGDPVLDPTALAALRELEAPDSGQALLDVVIGVFLKDAAVRLSELSDQIDRHDRLGAAEIAHRFKGSAAQLGARRLAELLGALEDATVDEDLAELLVEIEREYRRVETALRLAHRQ